MNRRLWVAGTLALLLVHASVYVFQCDDAFISFRYARNLAEGHGLVFNPGFERVEGYTNFLWVLILAAGNFLGVAPEHAANPLSIALTVVLWGLVAGCASRLGRDEPSAWPTLVAPVLLAATRSVAVWSTSGLETRLYEVLVVAGTLRLALESERPGRRPMAALLLALATLTRPDGLLVAACVLAAGALWTLRKGTARLATIALQFGVFWAVVGSHFLWRRAYYGEWLPNTYYAKVGGRTWWEMGWSYLAAFVLEYGLWLVIPIALVGALHLVRSGRGQVPLLFAAAVLPHAVYVASIGGDHFEYRVVDGYFPFLFLLAGEGVRRLPGRPWIVAAMLLVTTWIPWQSHRQFVRDYRPGFPGLGAGDPEAAAFLDPGRDPLLRWPGMRAWGRWHRECVVALTSRFVAIRQEEHRMFFGEASAQAARLRGLIDDGALPGDLHVVLSCVGVIPYVTDWRTLDRHGLTDRVVARTTRREGGMMAHDKRATLDYAASAAVDFWAEDPVLPVLDLSDVRLVTHLQRCDEAGETTHFAILPDGGILLGRLPNGMEAEAIRRSGLEFHASTDASARSALRERLMNEAVARRIPGSREARLGEAADLAAAGRVAEAVSAYLALDDGSDPEVFLALGELYAASGRLQDAEREFFRATVALPRSAIPWYNLGVARAKLGRTHEALEALAQAVARDTESLPARYALGAVALSAGQPELAREQVRRLREIGSPRSIELAGRLDASLATP